MGLFDLGPVFCDICGKNVRESIHVKKKNVVKDGVVCGDCWWQGHLSELHLAPWDTTVQQIQEIIDERKEKIEKRKAAYNAQVFTMKFEGFVMNIQERKWDYTLRWANENGATFFKEPDQVYSFDDIEEIWSNSGTVSYSKSNGKKQNGLGRAIVGGVLGGPTGALVGAVTARENISTDIITKEKTYLFIKLRQYLQVARFDVNSPRSADHLIDIFTAGPVSQEQSIATDPTEELRKYKALLDEGVITQQEFDAKKKQLLAL